MNLRKWSGPAAVAALTGALAVAPTSAFGGDMAPDSSGTALMEWAYDSWTVPWVQVRGPAPTLAPASHVTLMVLACRTADLERDRLARHLSREDCEHRMAAIRADQDSALIFRLDLRAFAFPGSANLARLDPQVAISLEDDQGHRWRPLEVRRGPVATVSSGLQLPQLYYQPPWVRQPRHASPAAIDTRPERDLTVAGHVVRFPRRDPRWRQPLVTANTRWIRLRVSTAMHEWVATWAFRTPGERAL